MHRHRRRSHLALPTLAGLLALAIGLLSVPDALRAAVDGWSTGFGLPARKPTSVIAVVPTNPATVFAQSNGNLMRSTDGGLIWRPWQGSGAPPPSVLSFTTDPSGLAPATVYVGGASGFYKSTDSGQSWSFIGSALPPREGWIWVTPSNPAIIYASVYNGEQLHKSTDGGQTWATVFTYGSVTTVNSVAVDPVNPNLIFQTYHSFWGPPPFSNMHRSTNGGANWELITIDSRHPDLNVQWVVAHPTVTNTFFASTSGGMYVTTDSGATWTNRPGVPGAYLWVFDRTNPLFVYSGANRSTDGGQTWSAMPVGSTINFRDDYTRTGAFAIDPTAPTTLYAGTAAGLAKSTDRGVTWTIIRNGLTVLLSFVYADQTAPSTLHAPGCSGAQRSTNGGLSWTAVGAGGGNPVDVAIIRTNPITFYAACNAAGLRKSTDAGTSWAPVLASAIVSVAVDPSAPSTVYAGTTETEGAVYKSTDGGTTWTPLTNGLPQARMTGLAVNPANGQHVYVWNRFGVYKSTDGGATWVQRTNGLPAQSAGQLRADPIRPDTVYAILAGALYRTQDGGLTWVNISANLGGGLTQFAFDLLDPYTIYVGIQQASGGQVDVRISRDAGASFTSLGLNRSGGTSADAETVTGLAPAPTTPTTLHALLFSLADFQTQLGTPSAHTTPDANGDGYVTAIDSLCILRQIGSFAATASCPNPLPFADVNFSGNVDSVDALCVLRFLNGFPATASCPLAPQAGAASSVTTPALLTPTAPAPLRSTQP